MNAERLHLIARVIKRELEQFTIVELLQQLKDALQAQVNQPQQPLPQQNVSGRLNDLLQKLEQAPSNQFNPAWQQILRERGLYESLGARLAERLRQVFERNQITPAAALKEITEIHQELARIKSALDRICDAFPTLRIPAEELQPGECELAS